MVGLPAHSTQMPTIDPAQTHLVAELKHSSPLLTCRFDPSGRFVFAGAQDNSIRRFALEGGAQVALTGHESWVDALAFDTAGTTLVSGGCDGRLKWWPAADAQPAATRSIDAHQGWVRAVEVNPGGTLVASAGNDRLVKIWELATGKLVRELPGHERHVYSLLFHPGGEFLLSGDLAGVVKQWNLATGELVRSFEAKTLSQYNGGQGVDYGGVRSLSLSADRTRLACSGLTEGSNPLGAVNDPMVLDFAWETAELRVSHLTKDKLKGVAWRCLWHPEGFLMGVSGGTGGGFLLFWKPDEASEFAAIKLPDTGRDFDLHPDKRRIATAHNDGHVRIWALYAKPA